jgi:hypothetical protein
MRLIVFRFGVSVAGQGSLIPHNLIWTGDTESREFLGPDRLNQDRFFSIQLRRGISPAMQDKTLERRPVSRRLRRLKPVIILAVVLLIVGGTGFLIVRQVKIDAAQIVEDTLPGLVYAGQINAELSENFARTLLVINSDSTEKRELYLKRIEEGSKRVNDSLQSYRVSIFEEEDRQTFNRLVSARDKYREVRRHAFDLVKEGKRAEAARLFETELLPAYAVQKELGEALFDYNVRQCGERGRHIETVCSRTQWFVAAVCVAIFVSGFFTPFFAIRLPPNIWK